MKYNEQMLTEILSIFTG